MGAGQQNEFLWQEQAEKLGGDALVQAIMDLRDGQAAIIERLDTMESKAEDLHNAFPAGDFEGHKRYHETVIKMLEEKRRLRKAIEEKTISGLIWAGLIITFTALWEYLKKKIGG